MSWTPAHSTHLAPLTIITLPHGLPQYQWWSQANSSLHESQRRLSWRNPMHNKILIINTVSYPASFPPYWRCCKGTSSGSWASSKASCCRYSISSLPCLAQSFKIPQWISRTSPVAIATSPSVLLQSTVHLKLLAIASRRSRRWQRRSVPTNVLASYDELLSIQLHILWPWTRYQRMTAHTLECEPECPGENVHLSLSHLCATDGSAFVGHWRWMMVLLLQKVVEGSFDRTKFISYLHESVVRCPFWYPLSQLILAWLASTHFTISWPSKHFSSW